jgi:hypothetical protein
LNPEILAGVTPLAAATSFSSEGGCAASEGRILTVIFFCMPGSYPEKMLLILQSCNKKAVPHGAGQLSIAIFSTESFETGTR